MAWNTNQVQMCQNLVLSCANKQSLNYQCLQQTQFVARNLGHTSEKRLEALQLH